MSNLTEQQKTEILATYGFEMLSKMKDINKPGQIIIRATNVGILKDIIIPEEDFNDDMKFIHLLVKTIGEEMANSKLELFKKNIINQFK